MIDNEKQLDNKNETYILTGILEVLATEYVKKGLHYKQVCAEVKKAMVLASTKLGNTSKVAIALATGIDRREINTDDKPHVYRNRFLEVITEIRNYHSATKKDVIAIKGSDPSIQFFSRNMSGRITLPAIIKELTQKKIIRKINKNQALIINTRILSVDNEFDKYNLITQQTVRQISTINHNYEMPNNKWLDYSISSTKINDEDQEKLNRVLRRYFNFYRPILLKLVNQYESDVPFGYYDEYSINFFVNISEKSNS
jgi:hypothetical protein